MGAGVATLWPKATRPSANHAVLGEAPTHLGKLLGRTCEAPWDGGAEARAVPLPGAARQAGWVQHH